MAGSSRFDARRAAEQTVVIEHRPFVSLDATCSGRVATRRHWRPDDPAACGALHACNDVEFAPHSSAGLRLQRDAVTVTWVRSGALTQEDDAGNRTRLVAGSVQATCAGTGVHRCERNDDGVPARLFQVVLRTRSAGGPPRCATRFCSAGTREGGFVTLASALPDDVRAGALPIDAAARVRVATLREGAVSEPLRAARAYLVADHGRIVVGAVDAMPRDGVAIIGESGLVIRALDDTEILLIEWLE